MCGFVGFVGRYENRETILDNMLDRIAHRGPDSQDKYSDEYVGLGFRRLSIIDLEKGSQPLYNEDRTKILVFNGEIYNYKILRKELIEKGHIFTTNTDSEVLLHGYEEYGKEFLCKLRGMFAFVIWDTVERKLFGARDYFGIKPFYYYQHNDIFLFGSEIKAFLPHPEFFKQLNEERLPDYLTFSCVPGTQTFFKEVYKLPPAHYLEYKNRCLKVMSYFKPQFNIDEDEEKDIDYFANKISDTFSKSVEAHKISDVEVGCFLSSGVDSSYVAAEMAKVSKMKTYTIGFDDKKYSEAEDAKQLADELQVENYVKKVSADEYFENVGKVQYYLDEPLANPSANLLYFLSKRASEDLKVVLSGEGADEMFGGYNVYKEPLALKNYQKIPRFIRRAFALLVTPLPEFKGRNFIVRGSKKIEERYIGNSNIFSVKQREKILKKKYKSKPPQFYTQRLYEKVRTKDDITKMQYVDMHVWMVQEILLKADKMSMANSLELRVPFLDMEIFKLASTIPPQYKVNKQNTKLALRKAANKDINDKSAERKKMAFPLPLPEWLREDKYYNIVKKYFASGVAKEYFNTDKIMKLLEEHKKGRKNNTRKIWTIFTFLVWYEQFFINNQ